MIIRVITGISDGMEAGIEGIVAGDYFEIVPTGRSGGGASGKN